MTYEEGIIGLPKQFGYVPEILNKEKLRPFKRVVVLGMGGSRLGADILNMLKPELEIRVHSDFDLPNLSDEALADALIVANSYSGDTIETVSGAKKALERGLNLTIIAAGGELLNIAHKEEVPHIQIPHEADLPARLAVGYDLVALAALAGIDAGLATCISINALRLEAQGKKLAGQLGSGIPLIYASRRFNELGYIWKVVLNETAKIPAFYNRFPELDHNELEGFERNSQNLHCFILRNDADPRIRQQMEAITSFLLNKNVPVTVVPSESGSTAEQIVSSMLTAHWMAVELAHKAKLDPTRTPAVEEFKKQIK